MSSIGMRLETKFLRLRTAVTLGSRFDDWRVAWIGGWTKHRLSFIVMVVRMPADELNESGEAYIQTRENSSADSGSEIRRAIRRAWKRKPPAAGRRRYR